MKTVFRILLLLSSLILTVKPLWPMADARVSNPLYQKIDDILGRSGFLATQSRFSIKIVTVPDGRVVYERNPELLLNPASNIKLITMATALKELGSGFTFKTEFYSDGLIDAHGRVHNLWIKGYGDPLLDDEELQNIVKGL